MKRTLAYTQSIIRALVIPILFCSLLISSLRAQEISISPEVNIRNYFSYELLGKISDRYLIYRDKGFLKEVDVFNEFMEHTQHSELVFEKKKTDVISTIGLDTSFQIVYGYLDNDSLFVKMRRYDKKVSLIDSSLITKISKKDLKRSVNSIVSENKSKLLLYTINKNDELDLYLYDNEKNRLAIYRRLQFPPDINLRSDIKEMVLSDKGGLSLLLYKQEAGGSKKDEVKYFHYSLFSDRGNLVSISLLDRIRRDIYLDYDNLNDKVIISGLYSERKTRDNSGVFLVSKSPHNLGETEQAKLIPFSESLVNEVSRTRKKKNKIFEHFTFKDIIKRHDGGVIMVMELAKEFSRRSSYATNYSRSTSYNSHVRRGWVDYYNEDIIVSSISPEGTVDWNKILYKKQFSQDDDALFSSFYIMLTPSRMRMLYNDEIKTSNTVSEYIVDPAGNVARNSLLSTDNQNVKLRFRDAVQLGSNELLVPSESNFNLSLIKITY